jgi:glycosyltransferase involved in cell wall biosynthesis
MYHHEPRPPARQTRNSTNLHIDHSWGGGASYWIRSFAKADPYCRNIVLRPGSTLDTAAYGISFSLRESTTDEIYERWVLQHPVSEVALENSEYIAHLERLIEEHDVGHVYISTFLGHSLDLLHLAVPTTIVYHDYFPFCPGLNLTFGEVCTSCSRERLESCLSTNPRSMPFRRNSADYWMKLRRKLFEAFEREDLNHVCPSASVAENLREVDDSYSAVAFRVIEHGIEFAPRDCFGGASEYRRMRILVLGRLAAGKGRAALKRLFTPLRTVADLFLVGCHEVAGEYENLRGVTVKATYELAELSGILDRIRPDVALFLAEIPETFSYTLSEALAHQIPVCVPRIGSFLQRVEHGNNGLFYDSDDESLIDLLMMLDSDRGQLRTIADKLQHQTVRTVDDMVEDYYLLRGDYEACVANHLASEGG